MGAILTAASLSFLDLSVQAPTSTSISIIENTWWLWVPPGLMIAGAVLAINFAGDG